MYSTNISFKLNYFRKNEYFHSFCAIHNDLYSRERQVETKLQKILLSSIADLVCLKYIYLFTLQKYSTHFPTAPYNYVLPPTNRTDKTRTASFSSDIQIHE